MQARRLGYMPMEAGATPQVVTISEVAQASSLLR